MKKFFTMAAIALFILTSCSDDDVTTNPDIIPNPQSAVLLKKTIETTEGEPAYTTNYAYNGNKMVSISDSEGSTANFTYTGNNITEIKQYEGTTYTQRDVLEYDNTGKLVRSYMYLMTQNSATRSEYTYNSNGTVWVTNFGGDLETQTTPGDNGVFTLVNNNITKVEYSSVTENYTYTTTVDPLSNIAGYTGWMLVNAGGGINNVATYNYSDSEGFTENTTIAYMYGANSYPTSAVQTDLDTEEEMTIKFFY